MSHPAAELQSVMFLALSESSALTGLIGSDHVFDEVPQSQQPPYVAFGKTIHNHWGTDTESGMEHEFEIIAWSKEKGRKQVYEMQQIIIDVLVGINQNLPNHELINLTHERSEIEPRLKQQLYRGKSVFRAVTEPII